MVYLSPPARPSVALHPDAIEWEVYQAHADAYAAFLSDGPDDDGPGPDDDDGPESNPFQPRVFRLDVA